MNFSQARDRLRALAAPFGVELYQPAWNQLHYLIREGQWLPGLVRRLREAGCYLVTVVGNDERELEPQGFTLYYLFSHPDQDLFLMIENPLPAGGETYPSISLDFPAVRPFEAQIADWLGLAPHEPGEHLSQPACQLCPTHPASQCNNIHPSVHQCLISLQDHINIATSDKSLLGRASGIFSGYPIKTKPWGCQSSGNSRASRAV